MRRNKKVIYKYTAIFEPAEEGGYIVMVPSLPGCVTQGETFEEARHMAEDAIKGYISVLQADGDPIPIESDEVIETKVAVPVYSKG